MGRVCALSPSPRGSVFFTCTNLSVCTQRRRFFAGHEPSIVDVKHTTQPRENNKSKFDRGIIWCAPRTFHGACGEASPSPRNVGNFRLQAKPASATRKRVQVYKTRSSTADQVESRAYGPPSKGGIKDWTFAGKEDWTGMGNSVEYFPQRVCRIYRKLAISQSCRVEAESIQSCSAGRSIGEPRRQATRQTSAHPYKHSM